MRRPLSSKAPAVTWRGAGSPGARMAVRVKPSTSFSAAVRPTIVKPVRSGPDHRLRLLRPRSAAKARFVACGASPSASTATLAPGTLSARRRREHRRPGGLSGSGAASAARSRSRAAAASKGPMSAFGFSAVKASRTGTPVEPASAISRSAVATRRSQSAALAQPLSMTIARRRAACRHLFARIEDRLSQRDDHQRRHQQTKQRQPPWALMRRFLAFQNAREDIQRRKYFLLRLGGVSRSSHQMTGSASRPHKTAGRPKESGSQLMRGRPRRSRRRRSWPCECAPVPPRQAGPCG